MATEKTTLRLSVTDQSNNTKQKNITDINPDATNTELTEFVDELSNLTTDIIGEVKKITTITDTVKDNLQAPVFYWLDGNKAVTTATTTLSTIMQDTAGNQGIWIKQIGNGESERPDSLVQTPYIKSNSTCIPAAIFGLYDSTRPNCNDWNLVLAAGTAYPDDLDGLTVIKPFTGTIVIAVDATDTYDSAEITLTITEG